MDTSKLKGLWEKVKDFFKNMSKKLRIILAAALAVILIAVAVLSMTMSNKPYTQLYQDLTPAEVSEIMTYFQNNGITDYQVNGTAIMVRNDQYASLLIQLAQAGYPKNASLYGSYYERVGALTTSSQEARTWLISTQQRLESSIRAIPNVLDAQVYLTPGEERTYVLEDISTETTAAVRVEMRSGTMLTDEEANGIRHMVSHAWSGMSIDSVSITDNVGNTYTAGEDSPSDAAELQYRMQERTNNQLRTQIKQLLDPLYGADNVSVAVNSTVEVAKHYLEDTTYRQPAGSYENGGLIGHEMGQFALTRDGIEMVGGVPGTETNADIPNYIVDAAQGVQDGDGVSTWYERDNKIDTTVEQIEYYTPRITDIGVAVTITAGEEVAGEVDEARLSSHIATVANIGGENPESRVSVLVVPRQAEPVADTAPAGFFTPENMPYLIIAAVALLLLVIVLVVVLSIRRKKKQKEEEDQRIIEEQLSEMGASGMLSELGIVQPGEEWAQPPPTTGADIMDINTEKSMELRKTVRQFVQNNPEVAALMLKTWLKGGEDDNG